MSAHALPSPFDGKEIWFLTGSQDLYGEETLARVAEQSRQVAAWLDEAEAVPVPIVWKPVLKDRDAIRAAVLAANADDACIGVIAWMHTFSPAKMWIAGIDALAEPLLQLHTQYSESLPWSTIDMDYMNLNQAAHGDREFGYILSRLGRPRKVVVGHAAQAATRAKVGVWARAAAGWDASPDAAPRERRFEIEPFAPLDVHDITVPRESEQSHLYLTCQGIAVRDERRWAMSVLTTILGGGMSSRLFQEVREKRGLAYTTYAFDTSYAGAGAFGLYAGCAPGDVEEVCAVMIGEFEKLAEHGVTEREMTRARGQLRGAMVLGGEDSLARMGRLGRAEVVTGRLRSMEDNLRRLEAVTPEEVREMAAWLVEQKRARILVGPAD